MDINGTANRVLNVNVKNSKRPHPDSESVYVWKLHRDYVSEEKKAVYKMSRSQPQYWLITNVNATNRYGNPRSYFIHPVTMSNGPMLPESKTDMYNAINWAKSPVYFIYYYYDNNYSYYYISQG